jgi:branched-chain amino acid aminotransferase
MSRYICYNGEHMPADAPVVPVTNRAFCFGDGVFETIRCLNSEPLFFVNHYTRLRQALFLLKIDLPKEYTESYFRKQIYSLLQQNRLYKGASVKIVVYRGGSGKYIPENNTGEYIITAQPLETESYVLNEKGIHIGIYDEILKPINVFSSFKNCNSLIFVMAGIYKTEKKLDDCLICNQEGRFIESISSNFFMVKNHKLLTPAVESGCVDGTMRRTIFEIAQQLNIPVIEIPGATKSDLLDADEVFLTNAHVGIKWVLAFGNKRYFHTMSNKLMNELIRKATTQS